MKDFSIPATQSTPAIEGVWHDGLLSMTGDSYPENSFEFFTEVIQWVEQYLSQTERPLHLLLRLMYLNTSSVKAMMDILELLEDAHSKGRSVSVTWRYDPRNERVVEMAQDFKEDCTFSFLIEADSQDEKLSAS